jgi:hypothetical protein
MNIYSGKIYTSVKITLFKNPACGKGKRKSRKKKNGKMKSGGAVDCPAFM